MLRYNKEVILRSFIYILFVFCVFDYKCYIIFSSPLYQNNCKCSSADVSIQDKQKYCIADVIRAIDDLLQDIYKKDKLDAIYAKEKDREFCYGCTEEKYNVCSVGKTITVFLLKTVLRNHNILYSDAENCTINQLFNCLVENGKSNSPTLCDFFDKLRDFLNVLDEKCYLDEKIFQVTDTDSEIFEKLCNKTIGGFVCHKSGLRDIDSKLFENYIKERRLDGKKLDDVSLVNHYSNANYTVLFQIVKTISLLCDGVDVKYKENIFNHYLPNIFGNSLEPYEITDKNACISLEGSCDYFLTMNEIYMFAKQFMMSEYYNMDVKFFNWGLGYTNNHTVVLPVGCVSSIYGLKNVIHKYKTHVIMCSPLDFVIVCRYKYENFPVEVNDIEGTILSCVLPFIKQYKKYVNNV